MELLTVGEAFEDLIFAGLPRLPRPGEELRTLRYTTAPGGGALITAVACARLGVGAGILTATSRRVARDLRRDRVRLVNLIAPDERGAVTVALSTPRNRSFVTFEGVNARLEPRVIAALRRLAFRPRHVHFALSPRRCRSWLAVVRRLHSRGATASWDFGWNQRLLEDADFEALTRAVDWLFVNEQEARLYARTRSLESAMRRLAPPHLVIKLGARGAVWVRADRSVRRPAPPARVADTTGAGDAFNGGFLAAMLRGATVENALRIGNYVGARSTEAEGGIAALPRANALPPWARRILEGR